MAMRQKSPKHAPGRPMGSGSTVRKTTITCRKKTRGGVDGILSASRSSMLFALGGTLESPAVLRKCKYAFLTLPNYSLIAVANALEPLRMANRLVGKDV